MRPTGDQGEAREQRVGPNQKWNALKEGPIRGQARVTEASILAWSGAKDLTEVVYVQLQKILEPHSVCGCRSDDLDLHVDTVRRPEAIIADKDPWDERALTNSTALFPRARPHPI